MSVEAVNKCLNGGFVEVAQIRGTLSRLLTKHERLWVDETESIYDDFALNGLDRINDHCNSSRRQLLERLLCVDIDRRKPAAKTRMRVVPTNNCLRTVNKSYISADLRIS